jgi:TfoX/Sxy family transcriptional regulator of competence genes
VIGVAQATPYFFASKGDDMAYSEELARRVRVALKRRRDIEEKKMFGGVCFLHKSKMFCGVLNDDLMVRLDPADAPELLKRPGVRPMDFTGKPMRGYLFVGPKGHNNDKLQEWLDRTLQFVATLPEKKAKRPSR